MPEITLAFEAYGTLLPNRDNAILLLHGFASQHRKGGDNGKLSGMIGPVRAFDMDRFFIISPNMLDSSFGSTGPKSENPATGKPYGPNFPEITMADIVDAKAQLVDHFSSMHLAAIIGYSYGRCRPFQMGLRYPERMRCLVPAAS